MAALDAIHEHGLVEELRSQLHAAQEALQAIRNADVDALVVETTHGPRIYTLEGADEPYRITLNEMSEGAANLTADGVVLYANTRLGEMLATPTSDLVGARF